jgi:hypothetical protein
VIKPIRLFCDVKVQQRQFKAKEIRVVNDNTESPAIGSEEASNSEYYDAIGRNRGKQENLGNQGKDEQRQKMLSQVEEQTSLRGENPKNLRK